MLLKANGGPLYPIVFDQIRERFLTYVASFFSNDRTCQTHILLKRNHSLRVSALAGLIGRRIHLTDEDITRAKIVGLLHDVGRFEQVIRYRTFIDQNSIDHGTFGADLLDHIPVLHDVDADTRDVIRCAVTHHNKATLPPDLEASQRLHTRIVRDADKLDILHLFSKDIKHQAHSLFGPIKTRHISENVLKALMKKEVINSQDVKSDVDCLLLKLAWVYDVNFAPTLRILRQRDYFSTFRSVLPQTVTLQAIFEQIEAHIDQVLESDPIAIS